MICMLPSILHTRLKPWGSYGFNVVHMSPGWIPNGCSARGLWVGGSIFGDLLHIADGVEVKKVGSVIRCCIWCTFLCIYLIETPNSVDQH